MLRQWTSTQIKQTSVFHSYKRDVTIVLSEIHKLFWSLFGACICWEGRDPNLTQLSATSIQFRPTSAWNHRCYWYVKCSFTISRYSKAVPLHCTREWATFQCLEVYIISEMQSFRNIDGLIDWLSRVLRRIRNMSAI